MRLLLIAIHMDLCLSGSCSNTTVLEEGFTMYNKTDGCLVYLWSIRFLTGFKNYRLANMNLIKFYPLSIHISALMCIYIHSMYKCIYISD